MSLNSLKRQYGHGSRREVLNRAIRAELPGGNDLLDRIKAVHGRLHGTPADHPSVPRLTARLAELMRQRADLASEIEAKHGVGRDTNRAARRIKPDSALQFAEQCELESAIQ